MNPCAKDLGMENSHFVTPDGIHDEDHYVSPRDLITVAKLVLEHPIISKYVSMPDMDVTTKGGKTLEWENSNKLLHDDLDYYCQYATGLKTGYTSSAGNCLISSFRLGSRDLLIGVFGCPEQDGRYVDTLLLFAKTFGLQIPEEPVEEVTDPVEELPEDTYEEDIPEAAA